MPVFFNRSMGRYRPGGPAPHIRYSQKPAAGVTPEWIGLKTIQERLRRLPDEIEKKVMNYALWKASEEVYNEVRTQAPVRSGRLRDSVRRQRRFMGRAVKGAARRIDRVDIGPTARYWHIVEFGAGPAEASGRSGKGGPRVLSSLRHYTAEGASFAESGGNSAIIGPRRRALTAQPFIRPAFDASHQRAAQQYRTAVQKKLLSPAIRRAMEQIQLD